jgi:hypothetical protein
LGVKKPVLAARFTVAGALIQAAPVTLVHSYCQTYVKRKLLIKIRFGENPREIGKFMMQTSAH